MLSKQIIRSKRILLKNYLNLNSKTIQSFGTQRNVLSQNDPKVETQATVSWERALPFSKIPGPSKYELVRGFLPGGPYYKKSATDMITHYYRKYGQLLIIPGLFGNKSIVVCLNPSDYHTIFRNEGKWPKRRNFDSMMYYREEYRKDIFQGVEGIITTSGEKWAHVRTIVNPILMQPKNARLYLDIMLEVNNEFLQRIREIRDPATLEMPATFEDDINRLAFESVAAVALNTQLGLIRKNRGSQEAENLLKSLREILDLAFELDIKPSVWKYYKTPTFKRMMKALDTLMDTCVKYINDALNKVEKDAEGNFVTEVGKEKSVLEKLLRHDRRIAVVMALDMMMAGVDTTSTTLTGILLCIAKNPIQQQKLRAELLNILPRKDSVLTLENMRNLPYLRACIKEGIRLYPIGPGTVRELPVDVVLSGYQMPKGQDVAIASNLLLREEQYVPRPEEFLPDRWLRTEEDRLAGEIATPFMYTPFGFGPRSCAGKRIVELELEITVSRLVRNFNIEFNYSIENAFTAKFINVPAIPLKFKFEEIKD